MGEVLPIPSLGDVFADVRGEDRTLRVSFHADRGVVVVSLWAGPVCRGSFRLAAGDIERLQNALDQMRTVAYWARPVGDAPAEPEPTGTAPQPDLTTRTPRVAEGPPEPQVA